MNGNSSIERLLEATRRGNNEALNDLLGRVRPYLKELIFQQLKQDGSASDLAQEVLVRVGGKFHQFQGESARLLRAWIRKIAARILVDHWRKKKRAPELDLCTYGASVQSVDYPDNLEETLHQIESLPHDYQRVLRERVFEGRKFGDIGERIGKSDVWARVIFYRALKKLRLQLGVDHE